MANDIVRNGESIEGLSIEGTSRDPLIDRGLCLNNNETYNRFIASFNVKSKIKKKISDKIPKIEKNSICDPKAELICDNAVIHSRSNKYSTKVSSHISHTHGANTWTFRKQTNVKITRAHQEILNRIAKREKLKQDNN